ncbi:MAG: DUF3616 domain-containing protein [Thiothrix sp.]|uniref:DUF3616 domain-containing protein n=1 Tax=Thiothrix sp. TaxID=1032 RepID=UPI0026264019|nr:DUF3616 domain-containing protein [Thiothrix sp.]MDD5391877.1 DUF3616 domain-containing protein [Thiothrix sp.]
MSKATSAHLSFAPPNAALRDALSAVVQVGNTLWVVNDETTYLERLTLQGQNPDGSPHYANHTRFALETYLRLPAASTSATEDGGAEIDTEGLAYQDGYLWLTGSHSLVRKKPETDKPPAKAFKQLEKVSGASNRYLLARIPLVADGATWTLQKTAQYHGQTLTAAQLHGDAIGNDLMTALRSDPHLQAFLNIPGKDNGFDIEGLAVAGKRLFLGLRGPVLRGWAAILELEVTTDANDPSILKLVNIGTDNRPYRKHFLKLDGLGVRDLCVQGDDLLILAGPTMSIDGPTALYRWQGGAQPDAESLVSSKQLDAIFDVHYGQGDDAGDDHAEGITLFQHGGKTTLLVVYDSAAASRKRGETDVLADIIDLR